MRSRFTDYCGEPHAAIGVSDDRNRIKLTWAEWNRNFAVISCAPMCKKMQLTNSVWVNSIRTEIV